MKGKIGMPEHRVRQQNRPEEAESGTAGDPVKNFSSW